MAKQNLVPLIAFCCTMAVALIVLFAARDWVATRGRIRSRLAKPDATKISTAGGLAHIRQSRGPGRDRGYSGALSSLNTLITQSGTTLQIPGLVFAALACAAASYAIVSIAGFDLIIRLIVAITSGTVLPIMFLRTLRDRRHRLFEEQLPEAIDTIVRSLKAGHGVSAAISTVSKHLSDPIGAEFRLASAEMALGLDLDAALNNICDRVGQPDLSLIALAVSIQAKTGGNLAEILSTLARVIRERLKLRARARALSSQSRISAYILTGLPLLQFGALSIVAPKYYGDVWDNVLVKSVLAGAVFWVLLGNYVMNRMARIRV